MAIKIRENPKIKGIKVLHSEHEISQFADDTSVILDGSEESLNTAVIDYVKTGISPGEKLRLLFWE